MATYAELRDIFQSHSDTHNKIEMALADIIVDILTNEDTDTNGYDDTNHDKRVKWAANTVGSKSIRQQAKALLWPVLVENKSFTDAQIKAATDTAFKNNLKDIIVEYTNVMGV